MATPRVTTAALQEHRRGFRKVRFVTPKDFARIERRLKIPLPQLDRETLAARAEELAAAKLMINGGETAWFEELLYLQPQRVIDVNLAERKRNSGTDFAFPGWWETF